MIRVPQPRDEVDRLISSYTQGSMQRQIITAIDKSPVMFAYGNIKDLEFEVNLRAEIIKASYGLYRSGMDFAVFRETRCNDRYWNRDNNGGFSVKREVSSAEAITDIFRSGRKYATECATAMVIVYYKALSAVFPKELFDSAFKEITLMNWHSLDRGLSETGLMNNKSADIPGDRRYFKNPDVDMTVPEWQGENTIDLGNGKYYGHGAGVYPSDSIINMLNKYRKQDAQRSAFLMETAGNPNYKKLSAMLTKYQESHRTEISA